LTATIRHDPDPSPLSVLLAGRCYFALLRQGKKVRPQ